MKTAAAIEANPRRYGLINFLPGDPAPLCKRARRASRLSRKNKKTALETELQMARNEKTSVRTSHAGRFHRVGFGSGSRQLSNRRRKPYQPRSSAVVCHAYNWLNSKIRYRASLCR